jgi:hypothetical protein
VHQVGNLRELYEDARLKKHKNFVVLLEVNYCIVMAEMHRNLSDHRCNCFGRFRLSLKHQPGTQILLAAGNLFVSVVKTFD